MRYGFKHKLNIKDYTKNAAKNFTFTKLIIFTAFSLFLTISLVITSLQYNYEGTALLFTALAFFLILGFTFLNISALIRKIRETK